jgi:hypothetical protein
MTTPTDQPSSSEPVDKQPAVHISRVAVIAAQTENQQVAPVSRAHPAWVIIIVVFLLVIIAAATVYYLVYGGNLRSTSDAYIEGRIIRICPRVSGPVDLAAFAIALGERAATRYHTVEGRT